MSPISVERIEFIKARLQVLGGIRKTLTRRQAYYVQSIGVDQHSFALAQAAVRSEELSLTVEYDVLVEFGVAP
jgi:hypothetical protein